jgi:hypothetical protein
MQMEVPNWRKLLEEIIRDPVEKQLLANALSVNPATLVRWVHNETNPRLPNVQKLMQEVPPRYRDQMTELILREFPEAAEEPTREDAARIPGDFYENILDAYTKTGKDQRFFTVGDRILKQALSQLDPNHLGMALSIALCVPPSPGRKVRSLREVTGQGTPPWQSTLTREALFLGIESLAGYALSKGRAFVAENRTDRLGFLPVRWEEWEESAVACPIWFEGRLAGCLVASSTQPGYFLPWRQGLIERYAQVLILALDPGDFYEPHEIQLLPMPARDVQHALVASFQQRLSESIRQEVQASSERQARSLEEIERQLWQQLEEELAVLLVQRTS